MAAALVFLAAATPEPAAAAAVPDLGAASGHMLQRSLLQEATQGGAELEALCSAAWNVVRRQPPKAWLAAP